jgi:N-dimethylarginine dimethylaminohydrolase
VDLAKVGQTEVGALELVLVKNPLAAFHSDQRIEHEWRTLGYTARPDMAAAGQEWGAFVGLLESMGVEITLLPGHDSVGLDSLYTRDASVVCDRGAILCRMGKVARRNEPMAQQEAFERLGVPILGRIEGDGCLEGGDVVWLDERTIAVGWGYRTNASGITQLTELLSGLVDEVIVAHLPHGKGPGDVFHLMSALSPVDEQTAVVYSPMLSVPFRETLLHRGMELVEVPDEEFPTLGCNVLAVEPKRCVMVAGNPVTRARLEAKGIEVHAFSGHDICLKGSGGPTCLTRPLRRRVLNSSTAG